MRLGPSASVVASNKAASELADLLRSVLRTSDVGKTIPTSEGPVATPASAAALPAPEEHVATPPALPAPVEPVQPACEEPAAPVEPVQPACEEPAAPVEPVQPAPKDPVAAPASLPAPVAKPASAPGAVPALPAAPHHQAHAGSGDETIPGSLAANVPSSPEMMLTREDLKGMGEGP